VIRAIRTAPDPILTQVCEPVTRFDDELATLILDLRQTMHSVGGAGLAAPQIGVPLRVFVIKDRPAFINPHVLTSSDERWIAEEGCFSLPDTIGETGIRIPVERPWGVDVQWQTAFGDIRRNLFSDWEGRAIQHELDHLNGVLITAIRVEVPDGVVVPR
jgi:peptide deformylase